MSPISPKYVLSDHAVRVYTKRGGHRILLVNTNILNIDTQVKSRFSHFHKGFKEDKIQIIHNGI